MGAVSTQLQNVGCKVVFVQFIEFSRNKNGK